MAGRQLVFAGDQLVGAKIVVGGRIEVDEPLLPQLHYGDRGEGLGDGGDPKDGVLGDGSVRRQVREAVRVEELQRSVADHSQGETEGRMAVEDRVHPGLHLQPIDVRHGPPPRSRSLIISAVMLIMTSVP